MELTTDGNSPPERSPEPLWNLVQHEMLHASNEKNVKFKDKRVPEAAWKFHDPRHYRDIYRWGTEREAEFEAEAIRNFNRGSVYQSWLILCHPSNDELKQQDSHDPREITRQQCLVILASEDTQEPYPKVGELCRLAFAAEMPALDKTVDRKGNVRDNDSLKREDVNYVKAVRLDNPQDQFSLERSKWSKYATFKVWVNRKSARNPIKPSLADFTSQLNSKMLTTRLKDGQKPRIRLDDASSFQAHVWMDISDTTMSVELNALETAMEAPPGSRINEAFSFIRTFKNTGRNRNFNLLRAFPHMQNPDGPNSQLPENLKTSFQGLDDDQKQAYKTILSDLPCRIGIFPGISGAGKTELMLTAAALALSKYVPRAEVCSSAIGGMESTGCPVLLIVEANRPASAAATRVVQHFEKLGRNDLRICRAFNINYEGKWNTRRYLKVDDNDEASSGLNFNECFPTHRSDHIPQARHGGRSDCGAATLKELAQQYLQEHPDDFPLLSKLLDSDPADIHSDDGSEGPHHREWEALFQAVLNRTDVVDTTPVGAAKIAAYFRPRLCIFDESARARELSTLVAIANFPSVEAWLFTGTCEMTEPYVGSYSNRHLFNPCANQLKASMMERCLHVIPDMHKLSVNHQAYGGLHCLSSDLFWGGSVQSAFLDSERFPPSTTHLLEYCRNLASRPSLSVPRLLVHVKGSKAIDPQQKSKFNEQHLNWVIQRVVRDLVQDQQFRSTDDKEAGSIIITTPYKAQFNNYRKGINELMRELDREHRHAGGFGRGLHREVLVEARTADTVQGHSSDVLVYDLVHSEVTDHVADSHRLCVALTRAKQAEIIVMHRGMVGQEGSSGWTRSSGWGGSHIDLLYEHCKSHGQVVVVDMDEKGHDEKSYMVQSGVDTSGHDLSAVPRQLPVLPASLNLAPEKVQVDTALPMPASDPQPPEAKHDEDVENMLLDPENFGFQMVRKAMELGLTLSSDIRKGQ